MKPKVPVEIRFVPFLTQGRALVVAALCLAGGRAFAACTDTVPPVLVGVPPNLNVQCAEELPPPANVTATDDVDGPVPVTRISVTNGACPTIITLIWTARDSCTNTTSATQTIRIQDTIPPVLVGVPTNIEAQCFADLPPAANVTATDNCDGPIPVTRISVTNGACPTIITLIWTARDRCTNSTSATQTIRVQDTIPPVLVGVPANIDAQCFADLPPAPNVTATDNCDGPVPVTRISVTNGACPTIITLTWVARDRCTNSTSATQTIRVQDTIPPVLVGVPPDQFFLCGMPLPDVTATDNCDGAIPVLRTLTTNGVSPTLVTATWLARDRCTNSVSATRVFTVQDTIPPTIVCPPNLSVPSVAELPPCPGSLSDFLAAGGTASDECDLNLTYRCSDGPLLVNGCRRTVARTHTVIDDSTNSASCVQVLTINRPPDCVVGITPTACGATFGDPTNLFVISLNQEDACLILDGSGTTDADNDPLTFAWSDGVSLLGTSAVVTNCLPLGCHTLTFVASDCVASCTQTLPVCVITACEAVEECIAQVEGSSLGRQAKRPLYASLKAVCASFERGNFTSGFNQLQAFQQKVQAQLGRSHPAEAQALIACAQQILDAIRCAAAVRGNNGVGNGLDPQPPGSPPVNDGPGTGPGNPGH